MSPRLTSFSPTPLPSSRCRNSSAAVTAAILAPAGPQRARILSTLTRDDRVSSLPQATILSKVFLEHIVRPKEVEAFEALLQPHQKAQLARTGNEKEMMRLEEEADADGATQGDSAMTGEASSAPLSGEPTADEPPLKSGPTTVLDRAMMEHNVLASSKIYMTVTFRGLGYLLGLNPAGTETLVRRMIAQGRLKAEIDQVEGLLTFLESANDGPTAGGLGIGTNTTQDGGAGGEGAAGSGGAGLDGSGNAAIPLNEGDGLIRRWDAQIARTAGRLEDVCVRIASLA